MPIWTLVARVQTEPTMSITIRPEMKTIVHEIDGTAVTLVGKTIDGGSSAFVAMIDAAADADRLRDGARVRCSYVDPSGVHEFVTTLLSVESLALNHRLLRVTIATPTSAERIQRREHVRVPVELTVEVTPPDAAPVVCTSVDLSAGGMAVVWPEGAEPVEAGAMVELRFRSDRFEHHHQAQALGSYQRGKTLLARFRFEGITPSGQDRLATVVFAAQREELRRQRDRAS